MAKKTLVFLTAWGERSDNFLPLLIKVRKKYQVLTPNLSSLVESKNLSWQVVSAKLDQVIGHHQVYLLGTSLGGGLALAYAAFFPNKVKLVIACEPAGIKLKRRKIVWVWLMVKMIIKGFFYPKGSQYIPKMFRAVIKEAFSHPGQLKAQLKLVWKEDLEKYLSQIRTPVYLFWSKNSEIFPSWVGEKFKQNIIKAQLDSSFSDKNHLFILEQDRLANEVIKIIG